MGYPAKPKGKCLKDTCQKQAAVKGYCPTHYRMYRTKPEKAELLCYVCKEVKPIDQFRKDKSTGRGYQGQCLPCRKAYVIQRNQDSDGEYGKEYYKKHKPRMQRMAKKWRKENKEKVLGYWHNYKAKLRNNGPVDKDITRLKVYERDQGTCKICNKPCKYEESSIDHKQPVSRGGTHTWGNVQLAHRICNIKKSARTMEEFNATGK